MLHTGLQELKSALAESALGKARIVVIEGPAGFGKSELLEAIAAHATDEAAVVLRAAALRSEDSLPLAVLRQLVNCPTLPAPAAGRLRTLVDDAQAAPGTGGPEAPALTARMQKLCTAFHDLMRDRLVVIAVDDLQFVDAPSLQYLLYLAGRSRGTRLLMVLTETLYHHQRDPAYRTEFLRQPHFRRLRLHSLGRRDVAALLTRDGSPPPDERTVEECWEVTGGNPLLVRALREEHATAPAGPPGQPDPLRPVTSEAFVLAVLTCVDRSGPTAAKVADALAILGALSSLDRLGKLCGLTGTATAQGLRALQAAAVIDGHRFRHPATRAGVLESMDAARRAELNGRAAVLLRADGACAADIARHVRRAEGIDEPWCVSVLQDAAEEVLAEDDDRLAADYLDLAHGLSTEARRRVEIRVRTAMVLRRSNPSASERVAEELLDLMRAGRVPEDQLFMLADLFVRHRRLTEVNEILAALRDKTPPQTPMAFAWSDGGLTAAADPYSPAPTAPEGEGRRPPLTEARNRESLRPWSTLVAGDHDKISVAAEELLRRSVLTDATIEPILSAAKCLHFAGKVDKARHWIETLLKESLRRNAGGWHAMFSILGADIAFQQGDLAEVLVIVDSGLASLQDRQGSVLASGLQAMKALAQTAMGDFEAVAKELNRTAPRALFGSINGVVHLRARGHYNLATNRPHAALDDFLAVGRLVESWGLDRPWWAAWRSDAAEAWLQLGHPEEAHRMAREELALTDLSHARARGICLRLLGISADPGTRLTLLTRAVRQLQLAGDRLELAKALFELSETQRRLGHVAEAAVGSRRAWQLAKDCRAEPLCARMRLSQEEPAWEAVPQAPVKEGNEALLSESEKKVAVLAACGYTNRDISSRLYITVSTVEQHLTRVYRKLNIDGRQQLPVGLQFEVSEIG
ncbi:LuxR family transcriptional regulator [Streptomyces sp. MP131-18]|uniref:helix-turn-helix transcriptional regulator n=1 Tax=Streptomyces sp. MP131-18 TaxID=1857892 RepID=UPI00097C16D5|nr:LuxR family transcriptional regulator [Streptomyces sp. MP131-18]ONK09942.1 transcriptional regulator MalT [Streptomyces sp. MP131-18]